MDVPEPRSTRRRVLAALAGAGGVGLAGCPRGGSDSSTPTATESRDQPPTPTQTTVEQDPTAEIHVYTRFVDEEWTRKWLDDIIPGFEAQSEATVQYEAAGAVPNRVAQLLKNGTPPEIAHGTLIEHGEWIARDETVPVDDLVADLERSNGQLYDPDSIRIGETTHIVPHGWSLGGVLNYRQDIYDALGLSVPETWAELLENARVIDEADDVSARGFGLPAANRFERRTENDFANWLYTAGGDFWQWDDPGSSEVAVAFRDEHVRAALRMLQNLAEVSPEPGSYRLDEMANDYAEGNIAQCVFPNGWLAGFAYENEATEIALNTRQAVLPLRNRSLDPPTRGWRATHGTPIFRRADNRDGAAALLRYMYQGPEKQAEMNLMDPLRWLPPYVGILDTDTYKNSEIFTVNGGHFFEVNRKLIRDIAPYHLGNRPKTAASCYARSQHIVAELVESTIGKGKPLDAGIESARAELRARLNEGVAIVRGS